jgi:hypothetical protein
MAVYLSGYNVCVNSSLKYRILVAAKNLRISYKAAFSNVVAIFHCLLTVL